MLLQKHLFCLFAVVSLALHGQKSDTLKSKRTDFLTDNKRQMPLDTVVDRVAAKFMQNPLNCGLSIAMSKDGATYFYNYGEVKRLSNTLPTPNTIYEIGSITSTFAGILLAQAVVDHKLSLEDDIRKYMPGKYPNLKFEDQPILVKHLANHTSGIPNVPENLRTLPGYDSLNPYMNYPEQSVYNYLHEIQLHVEPGTVSEYSTLGMALLGLIIETAYDRPFEDLVKEKICLPNNMLNTNFLLSSKQLQESAIGYNQYGKATPAWYLGTFNPAGGLKSSCNDMITYLEYNLSETEEAPRLSHIPAFNDRQTLGLGWLIKTTKQNNTLIWHNGSTFGFSAFAAFIKEKKCSVIVMANSASSVEYIGIAILNYLQQ